jgi:guanosine-3',5'-bis(diphosphate) 3'-pyrophosphohydrolase
MNELVQVLRAAEAASRWHVHQRRKGPAHEPYINHLLEVARLVGEATEGKDTELVIAALLHDAVEDCEVPLKMIKRSFGNGVASLVAEVTDDKSLNKAIRKRKQIDDAPNKSQRAKILKLADKTSNLRALTTSAAADWSVKRKLDYVQWARKVAEGLNGANARLEAEFDKAAEEAEGSLGP